MALWWVNAAAAGDGPREIELATTSGDPVPTRVHEAPGERLLLWLPGEHGLSPRQDPTTTALAEQGIEVWLPDLHTARFLPPGRYSLLGIQPEAIADLLAQAARTGKRVYVMAAGRSAALALTGIRAWQGRGTGTGRVGGVLLLHPNLFRRTPQGGEPGEYLPIVDDAPLPLYLLQPRNSAAYWRVAELTGRLERGGAAVFLHRLEETSDGFNTRPDFTPAEQAATVRLPGLIARAMQLLDGVDVAPRPPRQAGTLATPEREPRTELLRAAAAPRPAPALALPDLQGRLHRLESLRGQVVMVNFWATWCPPCVEELPSLQRLYAHYRAAGLEILAVDVGETGAEVRRFLTRQLGGAKPAFPVLLDESGTAFKDWQAYAFPTTLVLDRRHRIRYAVFGAFAWDSAEVKRVIGDLLQEPPADP